MGTTCSIVGCPELLATRMKRFASTATASLVVCLAVLLSWAFAPAPAQANHYDYLLPAPGSCGSAESGDMSKSYYEWTVAGMCLADHARARVGRSRLIWPYALQGSSYNKAADIAVCQPDVNTSDVHYACGRPIDYWVKYFGYGNGCTSWGFKENVYVGAGVASYARSAVSWWLHSDRHREALLGPEFTGGVLSYSGPGTYRGTPNTRVWVYHFGYCR